MTTPIRPAMSAVRQRFSDLHAPGVDCFVLPNPWDVGSARLLQHLGFHALATTSAGFAASIGRLDMSVTLDELAAHVEVLAHAVDVPLNVDAERLFGETPDQVSEAVDRLAEAGASGISIEDWDPATNAIDPIAVATDRVRAAAEACERHGIVLTGRAENLLHGINDLDGTIERLRSYRDAGARCVYAPGLVKPDHITRVVEALGATPVNVLVFPGGPTVPELGALGVRRVSTGAALAWAAYGALVDAATELQGAGTDSFRARSLTAAARSAAFNPTRPANC